MIDSSLVSSAGQGIQLFATNFGSLLAGRTPGIAHSIVDAISIARTSRQMGRFRLFRKGAKSRPLREHVEETTLPGKMQLRPGIHYVAAETDTGSLNLGYVITRWFGPGHPTLIYHHANREDPFNMVGSRGNSFRELFLGLKTNMKWNILAVRAPFHGESEIRYAREMQHLDRFCAMMAASVRLVDSLARAFRDGGCPRVVVAGLSLGGWVANLHRTYCGTADAYVPLLAGASLDDVFLSSTYRMLTANLPDEDVRAVRMALNFEADFADARNLDVFPLLAKHDRIVRYETQRACYGPEPVAVMDRGHVTAILSVRALREHIWRHAVGSATDELGER